MLLYNCVWTLVIVSAVQVEMPGRPAASAYREGLAKIALATAYLEAGELRLAEKSLLEANRCQIGNVSDLAAAALANAWGGLHLTEGRYAEARADFAGGLERIPSDLEAGTLNSTLLDNLAPAEVRLGLYQEALHHQQEALQRWQVMLPANPLRLINAYVGLGAVEYLTNDLSAADASMLTAMEETRLSFGDRSPVMAHVLESHAIILRRLGRKREARAADRRAHRIRPVGTGLKRQQRQVAFFPQARQS